MVLEALGAYFHTADWKRLFLQGGCYWLADVLHQGIAGSFIMINREEEHCALDFEGGLYDVSGRISRRNFRLAEERDIRFMQKNYKPGFDGERLRQYLETALAGPSLTEGRSC